jgi:hypothetical protein
MDNLSSKCIDQLLKDFKFISTDRLATLKKIPIGERKPFVSSTISLHEKILKILNLKRS